MCDQSLIQLLAADEPVMEQHLAQALTANDGRKLAGERRLYVLIGTVQVVT